jgi:hypothetical protein
MSRRLVGAGLATLLAALVGASSASAISTESLVLDSRGPGSEGFAGPVATSASVPANRFVVARVRGTIGAFTPATWTSGRYVICGRPGPTPLFPSLGAPGRTPAHIDAETIWALPVRGGCGDLTLPAHNESFEASTNGTTYDNPEARGGARSTPLPSHTYAYVLRGTGAPVSFRFADRNLGDNSGELRIQVRDARNSDCNGVGWQDFGAYSSRAQCRALVPAAPAV